MDTIIIQISKPPFINREEESYDTAHVLQVLREYVDQFFSERIGDYSLVSSTNVFLSYFDFYNSPNYYLTFLRMLEQRLQLQHEYRHEQQRPGQQRGQRQPIELIEFGFSPGINPYQVETNSNQDSNHYFSSKSALQLLVENLFDPPLMSPNELDTILIQSRRKAAIMFVPPHHFEMASRYFEFIVRHDTDSDSDRQVILINFNTGKQSTVVVDSGLALELLEAICEKYSQSSTIVLNNLDRLVITEDPYQNQTAINSFKHQVDSLRRKYRFTILEKNAQEIGLLGTIAMHADAIITADTGLAHLAYAFNPAKSARIITVFNHNFTGLSDRMDMWKIPGGQSYALSGSMTNMNEVFVRSDAEYYQQRIGLIQSVLDSIEKLPIFTRLYKSPPAVSEDSINGITGGPCIKLNNQVNTLQSLGL